MLISAGHLKLTNWHLHLKFRRYEQQTSIKTESTNRIMKLTVASIRSYDILNDKNESM